VKQKAVFLSYASQDADAARRICDALRAAAIEVWFDQSELRGGDAWDASIRARIKDCTLFVPVVSANTDARGEGYFRLEWKLGVARSQLMADDEPFLVPIVIDETAESTARVPDAFRERQWTRLKEGDGVEAFAARVKGLLESREDVAPRAPSAERGSEPARRERRNRRIPMGLVYAVLGMAFAAYIATHKPAKDASRKQQEPPPAPTVPASPNQ
jgi:hypothetical protein